MWHRKMQIFSASALALAVAVAAGCGDDNGNGTGPETDGTFTATVTGDVTASLDGSAAFGVATQGGETAWTIVMIAGEESTDAVSIVHLGNEPQTTTYQLVNLSETPSFESGTAATVLLETNGDTYAGSSVSGTVTITSVSESQLRGSFTINASGSIIASGGGATDADVTVSGEFNAIGGSGVITP